MNLSDTKAEYRLKLLEKAQELEKTGEYSDLKNAAHIYGGLGDLKKMDELIVDIIRKNPCEGVVYSEYGRKYHQMHEK